MKIRLLIVLLLTLACATKPPIIGKTPAKKPGTFRVALGSCNKTTLPQPLWKPILATQPDVWVWLGDIIYADTDDMSAMKAMYETQLNHEGYRELRKQTRIIGVWDDHDYGCNNCGKEYSKRHESQQLLLDFLGEPADSPRRKQAGVYWSYTYGEGERKVKIILLDTRYNRDAPGTEGDLLGEEQWKWLEQELRSSTAQVNIIGSSIQVIPEEQRFEKWVNFPKAHQRFFKLLEDTAVQGVILISGDRHFAEISRKDGRYPLYELTSSGLTHASNPPEHYPWTEPNRYRIGHEFRDLNYGLIDIEWETGKITLSICGYEGLSMAESFNLKQLRSSPPQP